MKRAAAATAIEPSPFDTTARCLLDAHHDNLQKKKSVGVASVELIAPTYQRKWSTTTIMNGACEGVSTVLEFDGSRGHLGPGCSARTQILLLLGGRPSFPANRNTQLLFTTQQYYLVTAIATYRATPSICVSCSCCGWGTGE